MSADKNRPPTDRHPERQGSPDAAERSALTDVAATIADAAGPVLSAAWRPMEELASGARRMIGERAGARVRRVRRLGHEPLANLWELVPEAHRAAMREVGLVTLPVEAIAGTAVEGPTQRGGDFLPLRDRRGDDWRARWQRILHGIENLANLPPIEVIKFGDRYWVTDGHNRVAAALYTGQIALDANVIELRLPGMPATPAQPIAELLEGSADVRAAGSGRFTRTGHRHAADDSTGQPE